MSGLLLAIFDLIGTVAFAISGAITGIQKKMDIFGVSILGLTAAVGGGILRDLMAHRMPSVLYKDIYATAALFGAIVACSLQNHVDVVAMAWICFVLVISLRFSALFFGWHLFHPRPNWRKRK